MTKLTTHQHPALNAVVTKDCKLMFLKKGDVVRVRLDGEDLGQGVLRYSLIVRGNQMFWFGGKPAANGGAPSRLEATFDAITVFVKYTG